MSSKSRTIAVDVMEALKSDETLSSYVKSFTLGGAGAAQKLFPLITRANLRCEIFANDTSADIYVYSVDILAGTRSLAPGLAFDGNDAGRKGIVQLCNDIVHVLRTNSFGGLFCKPVSEIGYKIYEGVDSGGAVWYAGIAFKGEAYERQ